MISLADYFTLHGKPETAALMDNAIELIRRINWLIEQAEQDEVGPGIDQVSGNPVASGYRPAGANAATSNAAVRSTHLTCEGIDLQDHLMNRDLAVWCCKNQDKLAAADLYMEDPRWTGGRTNTDPWVHLQSRGPKSGKRIYVPSMAPATDPDFYVRFGLKAP